MAGLATESILAQHCCLIPFDRARSLVPAGKYGRRCVPNMYLYVHAKRGPSFSFRQSDMPVLPVQIHASCSPGAGNFAYVYLLLGLLVL